MNSNNMTATPTSTPLAALMLEVLRPCSTTVALRTIKPAEYAPDSFQCRAISREAEALNKYYYRGISRVRFNEPAAFMTACAETYYRTSQVVEQTHADVTEAAIALAIFRRAGLQTTSIKPTTRTAQDEMVAYALGAARHLRLLFAKQQDMALAA